jgi:NAD(P)-dependent dehydrogenase (short-subunit alcohol dehydrogenase family)
MQGGDSGIGRSVALLYALEGADVVINYLEVEEKDAQDTKKLIEEHAKGRKVHLIAKDISKEENCKSIVKEAIDVSRLPCFLFPLA